jgi:hypothetical protein
MTTVSLSELLSMRDESLAVSPARPDWISAAWRRVRLSWRVVAARVALAVLTLAALLQRHGLVLAGLASFVIAASIVSALAAWIMAGVSLLFLEVRRK